MRTLDKVTRIGRRDFLRSTAGAAAIAAVAPTASAEALAEPLKTVAGSGSATLVKMARDLYPHDRLPDAAYQKAVATIDASLAADAANAALLADGIAQLDAAATKLKGKPYMAIADEADRVEILKAIEATPFFAKMRSGMVTALYNQPDLWIKLGYEGPSFDKGGYIERGFNDLDWL
jgi:hypothetical protein